MTAVVFTALVELAKTIGFTVIELAQGDAIIIARIDPIGKDLDDLRKEGDEALREKFRK